MRFVDITAPSPGVPRDGWDRPLVVPKGGGKPTALTRTTTFIDAIEDKSSLTAWGKRMTLVGAARQPSILNAVRDLNPDDAADKRQLNALTERAVSLSGANAKRERGTHLHTLSEYVDRGDPLPATTSELDLRDMSAYMAATVDFDIQGVEQFVVVPELAVGGTFDRLLSYSGPGPDGEPLDGLFIGDLKTGSVQYGALKMASQLAVYSRGEFYDHTRFPVDTSNRKALTAWKKASVPAKEAVTAYAPLPEVSQQWGIIIHLPAGSGECTLYWVNLEIGWRAAKLSRDIRQMRGVRDAMRPWVTRITHSTAA
ncbi:hypothetical protein GCM10010211_00390 [Streptomyces albospinus]|uniref:Exonuclease n=1 Tax=Streptomyces albospinus TaxID=285515 RepID=A0ABQ2ULS2_9ACTN|nr:hypothetical protein [Streptomyces albospinus]GGU41353.1 hypothetical protein GCM10010211_00390 [Streptomyces albospinus]